MANTILPPYPPLAASPAVSPGGMSALKMASNSASKSQPSAKQRERPTGSLSASMTSTQHKRISQAILNSSKSQDTNKGPIKEMTLVDKILTRLLYATNQVPGSDTPMDPKDMTELCHLTREKLMEEPMLLEVDVPVAICGDIHGQFHDLLRIFENDGEPSQQRYLFLGDYVDRGKQSVETICLLFALKLRFPTTVYLLRGNHECGKTTKDYGFYDECKRKYSVKMWRTFIDTFDCLPVAAVVADRVFCVHGGLSPDVNLVTEINRIQRPTQIPEEGPVCDLLWSDPDPEVPGWAENERGVSYTFGCDVIERFLANNNLDLIVRAHEVVEDGYQFICNRKLITVFSAPNYTGEMNNKGAVLKIDENLKCRLSLLECKQKVPDVFSDEDN